MNNSQGITVDRTCFLRMKTSFNLCFSNCSSLLLALTDSRSLVVEAKAL